MEELKQQEGADALSTGHVYREDMGGEFISKLVTLEHQASSVATLNDMGFYVTFYSGMNF